MNENRTVCDVCGAVKKETNHWWNVEIISVNPQRLPPIVTLSIRAHDRSLATKDAKDACGEKCITVLVSRFLCHGSLEKE